MHRISHSLAPSTRFAVPVALLAYVALILFHPSAVEIYDYPSASSIQIVLYCITAGHAIQI